MGFIIMVGERAVPLPAGRHHIGRERDCLVKLEDTLVSRHHAELVVSEDSVVLRDLGSRNGIYLKYRRLAVEEEVRLVAGDGFLIGATNLVLGRTRAPRISRTPETAMGAVTDGLPVLVTAQTVPYRKFLAEAERSYAAGDMHRFAGATHLLLATLGGALEQGLSDDEALEKATRYALKLAELRGVEWIDQLLGLYDSLLLVPSIDVVNTMRRLFTEHGWASERLDRYVEHIRPVLEDAGPRGRALLAQLDSLCRVRRADRA